MQTPLTHSAETLIRMPSEAEIEVLAKLWHEGWQDAHARILPAQLARYRTLPSFAERLRASLSCVRVAGEPGAPLGFCMVQGDELNQLYVSGSGRGTGVGAALLKEGEARMVASGITQAWLACAIGNERAAKFYRKHGWSQKGTMTQHLSTPNGPFPLVVWRYGKDLRMQTQARDN